MSASHAPERIGLFALIESMINQDYTQFETDLKSNQVELVDKSFNRNIIHCVAEYGDLKCLQIIFKIIPLEKIALMAREIHNKGFDESEPDDINDSDLLVINKLEQRTNLSKQDQQKMIRMLEALPLAGNIKHCHELIDSTEIQRRFPDAKGELLENLSATVWAINYVRQLKIYSNNHPSTAHLITSYEKLLQEDKKTDDTEKDYEQTTEEEADTKALAEITKATRRGNCERQASLAKQALKEGPWKKLYPTTHLYEFSNSDHVFLSLGEGANQVYFDPWAGTFGTTLAGTINGYYSYWSPVSQKYVPWVIPYNPRFHEVEPSYAPEEKPENAIAGTKHKSPDEAGGPAAKKMRTENVTDNTQKPAALAESATTKPKTVYGSENRVILFKAPGQASQQAGESAAAVAIAKQHSATAAMPFKKD